MILFPKEGGVHELQYFSPSMNIKYGKRFDVSPALMKRINLTFHRDDFIRVTDADVHKLVIVTAADSAHYGGAFSLI